VLILDSLLGALLLRHRGRGAWVAFNWNTLASRRRTSRARPCVRAWRVPARW
jgi:hypothetical protein